MAIQNILSLGFLVPRVAHQFDPSGAIRGLRGMPRSLTLVGHYDETNGQIEANKRTQLTTRSNAIAMLGKSQLLDMWQGAKDNATLGMPIYVIALKANAAATAAEGSIAMTGTARMAGTLHLWVGSTYLPIAVKKDDDAASVAARMTPLVNAAGLAVTATVAGGAGTVMLKYAHKGESGNLLGLRVNYGSDQLTPDGLNVAVNAMSGGATNPSVTPAIAAIDGDRATEIVSAFTDSANLSMFETELEKRWGPMSMMDGQLCYALQGTEGEIVTKIALRNSEQGHCIATRKDLTPSWVAAAMVGAAVESSSWTDPSVPYTGIKLKGYQPADKADEWDTDQQNVMLANGVSILNGSEIFRMVTNKTKNPLGADDASYRNLNWVKTLSYYRWFVVSEFQLKYRGFKIAEYITEAIPGQKVMTKELGEEIMLKLYDRFVDVAIMQNPSHYKKTLLVEIDGTNGKLKVIDEPVLVTQHYQSEITSRYVAGSL